MVDTLIADILRLSKYKMLYNMLIKYAETSQEKQSCRLFQTSINRIQTDGGSGEICKPSLPGNIDHIKCNRAAFHFVLRDLVTLVTLKAYFISIL